MNDRDWSKPAYLDYEDTRALSEWADQREDCDVSILQEGFILGPEAPGADDRLFDACVIAAEVHGTRRPAPTKRRNVTLVDIERRRREYFKKR